MERYATFVLIARNDQAAAAVTSDRSHLRSVETNLVQGAATQNAFRNLVIFIPRRAPESVYGQVARAETFLR